MKDRNPATSVLRTAVSALAGFGIAFAVAFCVAWMFSRVSEEGYGTKQIIAGAAFFGGLATLLVLLIRARLRLEMILAGLGATAKRKRKPETTEVEGEKTAPSLGEKIRTTLDKNGDKIETAVAILRIVAALSVAAYTIYYFVTFYKTGFTSSVQTMIGILACVAFLVLLPIMYGRFFRKFIIGIVLFCVISGALFLVRIENNGWSIFNNRTEITIDNRYYAAALERWNELDYLAAETNLLAARDEESEEKSQSSLEVAKINQNLGVLYLDIGRYEESYELLNSAYTSYRNKLGDTDNQTILAKCQIHLYDIRTGNVERGFAGFNEAYDHMKTISYKMQICQMLAQSNMRLGNYKAAERWYNLLADWYVNMTGTGNSSAVNLANDVGVLMHELGEYENALGAYTSALNWWSSYAMCEDTVIANVYSNMAVTYAALNRTDEAIEAATKSFEIYKNLFGEKNAYIAVNYQSLGNLYGMLQQPEKKLEYLNLALETAIEAFGENHALTAVTYSSLSDHYSYCGDLNMAIALAEKALEIRKNLLGRDSLLTSEVYIQISSIYSAAGECDRAVDAAIEAIEINESLFGRDNINTASAYLQAAWAYSGAGGHERATELARRGLDINRRMLPDGGAGLAYAYMTLGYVLGESGSYDEAELNLKKAVLCYTGLGGELHTAVGNAYCYLGGVYEKQGNYTEALAAYLKTYEIYPSGEAKIMERLMRLHETLGIDVPFEQWFAGAAGSARN